MVRSYVCPFVCSFATFRPFCAREECVRAIERKERKSRFAFRRNLQCRKKDESYDAGPRNGLYVMYAANLSPPISSSFLIVVLQRNRDNRPHRRKRVSLSQPKTVRSFLFGLAVMD